MKAIKLAVAIGFASMVGAAADAAPQPPSVAPFYQFADAMNAGHPAQAARLYTPTALIIDEFAPHVWKSFGDWNRDFAAFFKAGGGSAFHMSVSAPSFRNGDPTHAYAVAPTTLRYKIAGKPTMEKGMFTFSTIKTRGGWKITGWAWSTL